MTPLHSEIFEALGTRWTIQTLTGLPSSVRQHIAERIEEFDKCLSRFRPDSTVSHMAVVAGRYAFPDWLQPLFAFYKQLYDATGGRVTPLIGAALARAGYDANYSFRSQPQSALPRWEGLIQLKGATLILAEPALLDFGAAGKGFLVDEIGRLMEAAGIDQYVIDASGDIRHRGNRPERIGLEHPTDSAKVIGVVELQNGSLCASATNRRQWGNGLHHVFDPVSLAPTDRYIATWVTASDTMTADGLATALFFVEPQALSSFGRFDYLRIDAESALDYSTAFRGQLV